MKVRPNPRYAEFVLNLGRTGLKSKLWKGVTFRSVQLEFAAPTSILSGEGSRLFGGRWNAPGSFPVIYSSARPGAAVDEAFQLASDFELAADEIKPRVTCGIEWELSSVIDLTARDLPSWVELAVWMKEDFVRINDGGAESLGQAFGRAVRNSGIAGMFCPSVRVRRGMNLVVFRDRLGKADRVRLLGKEELQKHLA